MYWVNTRELNGVSVTKCLSYIHLANNPYYTNLAYSKEIYILHIIDMWNDVIVLESSMMFYVLCDHVTDL